jgi:hypothetical protein
MAAARMQGLSLRIETFMMMPEPAEKAPTAARHHVFAAGNEIDSDASLP